MKSAVGTDSMTRPSKEEFCALAEKFARLPLARVYSGAPDALALAKRLGCTGPGGFLLESLNGSPEIARYTIMGRRPMTAISSRWGVVSTHVGAGAQGVDADDRGSGKGGGNGDLRGTPAPEALRRLLQANRMPRVAGLPPFTGGAVGYLGYDAGHWFEELPRRAAEDLAVPDCRVMLYDEAVVIDHVAGETYAVVSVPSGGNPSGAFGRAADKLAALASAAGLGRAGPGSTTAGRGSPSPSDGGVGGSRKTLRDVSPTLTKPAFERMVRACKEHIYAGDIYQANLSLRLDVPFDGDPFALYQTLRSINPSPFAGYLDCGDMQLVSSSPERLIRLVQGRVDTRPIAGTRRRGRDVSEDEWLTGDLVLDPKERAEHIMLVDLERNDIGRVCRPGTVRVNELMVTERYSHVMHIVSNVQGVIAEDRDGLALVRATFPGGTITGCPKIRSMEIIDELEPVRRGVYTGSMGYLGYTGDMDLNIIIRTIMLQGGMAHAQAGAGIVADSDPAREYDESMRKAQAMLEALDARGLEG